MIYELATIEEVQAVYDLVQHTIKTVYPKYYPAEVVVFFCELHSKETIRKDIENGYVSVLKIDGNIVGTGCFVDNHITRVYVLPEHQKMGYGTFVIKNIEDSIAALNRGVTDKYKLFIIVESIEDAYRLAQGYDKIRSVNLGGCKPKEDVVKTIYKTIPVTARDEELLKEMLRDGIEVEIRQVPGDQRIIVKENM